MSWSKRILRNPNPSVTFFNTKTVSLHSVSLFAEYFVWPSKPMWWSTYTCRHVVDINRTHAETLFTQVRFRTRIMNLGTLKIFTCTCILFRLLINPCTYITPSNPFHLDLIKHYWQSWRRPRPHTRVWNQLFHRFFYQTIGRSVVLSRNQTSGPSLRTV